jgi:hypothetical protein
MSVCLDFHTERRRKNLSNQQPLVNWDAVVAGLIVLVFGIGVGKFVIAPVIAWLVRVL